jgi:hypothetical protein
MNLFRKYHIILSKAERMMYMAKSKAKKYREKLEREGLRNPESSRSQFAFVDMSTRMTKTKKDVLYHCKHKNHFSKEGNDGSFYFHKFGILFQ